MIRAFLLSVGQLGDARFLAVFAKSMALTLALFALGGGAIWWAATRWLGDDTGLAAIAALFATLLGFWVLFRIVAIAVVGLFADEVVAAVEARHYPLAARQARPVAFRAR